MAAHVASAVGSPGIREPQAAGLGVYHGFRRNHIQAYLDEFVFRWNRRRHYSSAFDMLMDIGLRINLVDYKNLVGNPI